MLRFKTRDVFDTCEHMAALALRSAGLVEDQLANLTRAAQLAAMVRDVEHESDAIARGLYGELPSMVMPPIAPLAIRRLVSALDDVVDAVEEVAARLDLYDVSATPTGARELARALTHACEEVVSATVSLRRFRESGAVLAACRRIGDREREADQLFRAAVTELFATERDGLTILKWNDLLQLIEAAADRCDDVSNVVEGIVLEEVG